jgi:hypothetical protein
MSEATAQVPDQSHEPNLGCSGSSVLRAPGERMALGRKAVAQPSDPTPGVTMCS